MVATWAVVLSALVYLCFLFTVAHWGDNGGRRFIQGPARSTIAALALAVYCTSWTFFGSVGLASRSGFDFLAIYIGPILVDRLGLSARRPDRARGQDPEHLLHRRLRGRPLRQERAGRGPRQPDRPRRLDPLHRPAAEGGLVLPRRVPRRRERNAAVRSSRSSAISRFVVALVLAGFAVAFGTRHTDATEHQNGLLLAISLESVVKLIAFLIVGGYVTFVMFDGYDAIVQRLNAQGTSSDLMERPPASAATSRSSCSRPAPPCFCRASST